MSSSSTGKVWVYRREGIPVGTSKEDLLQSFPLNIRDQIQITSLSAGIDLNKPTLTATFSFDARPGDELLHSEDKDFYGFTPLYTPERDIEVDIIALTGLAGHAFGSWAVSPHMWLRDFLPEDLPRARILIYGYDSNLAGSQSRNILTDLRSNFVVKLHTMQCLSRSELRPMILIGHSLGCLIINDALIEMRSQPIKHLTRVPPVVKATIFFGAPHRGLNITAMQSIMNGTPSAGLIHELERQSPTIQRLNDSFRHLCEGLEILTIYEKKPTATLRKSNSGRLERTGPLEMMVEKESALLYSKAEVHIGLDQDHSRIAKVDRGQNGCYDDIVCFIRGSLNSGSTQNRSQEGHDESHGISSAPVAAGAIRSEPSPLLTHGSARFVLSDHRDIVNQGPSFRSKSLRPLFLVPFERDHSFINRIEIFKNINEIRKQHGRVALSGIGGIGKSQIAIEYCYRFRDDHPHAHIFWVHASTRQRFDQAYRDIARRFELPGWRDPSIDTLRLVSDWFNETEDETWLMVLDNADDLDTFFVRPTSTDSENECISPLSDYLPRSSGGCTLITTRDERLGQRLVGMHALVVVNQMSPQEAQDLLEKRHMDPSASSDNDPFMRLLEALGYIPLAIAQAAAFISENNISLTQYLEMFHKSDSDVQDILNEDLGDRRRDAQACNSIIKTWKMSFDLISKQKPRAADMLSLMAVLDRQGVPESLLRQETDRNIDFIKALGILQAFSLVSAGVDGAGYEIHRLVQLATQKWLEIQGKIEVWQEKALLVVANMFPLGEFETWKTCESLLPHAQKVIQNADVIEKHPSEFADLLSRMAWFDCEQGRYETACARYSAAVEVQKQTLGIDHNSTLASMNGLAITYFQQRRLKEVEELFTKLFEAKTRKLGAGHPHTLIVMSNLGLVHRDLDRWEDARKLSVEAVEKQKGVLGAEHPDTLNSMSRLAGIYCEVGQWEEAKKLSLQVIEISQRVLGLQHPNTLHSMNILALTYGEQRLWKEAEKLHLEGLEAEKRVLGAEHPETLRTMYNLAHTYTGQGRWEEAEKLHLEGLEAEKRVLGAESPDTLSSMNNLATTYAKQGRWEEAEKLIVQVLEARKRVLGAEHLNTLLSMFNLAVVWKHQGRHGEAIALMENVVDLRTKRLGADHPRTKAAADRLKEWSAN